MRLLFDENLAARLAGSIADLFPESVHVRDVGLRGASDDEVWLFARERGFTIVTKDADFQHRALVFGSPPKVVWMRLGNRPTVVVEAILRRAEDQIRTFASAQEGAILILD